MQGPIGPESFYKFNEINAELDRLMGKVTGLMGDIQSLNQTVSASSASLKTELSQLLTVINKGVDGSSLEAYGKRIQSVTEQIKGQQAAIQGLQSYEDQLSATHKTQSQRVEELVSKYASLNGTSEKVISQKQKIAKELAGLVKAYERLDNVVDQGKTSLAGAGNTYNRLTKQVSDWKTKIRELDDAFDSSGAINRFNAKAMELRDNILKGETAIRKMDSTLKTAGSGPSRGGSTPSLPNGIPGEAGVVASAGRIAKGIAIFETVKEIGEVVLDFGKDIVEITAKFEKYNAILATTLGSSEAGAAAFEMIQDVAAKTNFSVDEWTESYIKLANRGLRPGQEELMRLADVANSTGKPMKDLVEAVSDINNTERWNEFGIKAKTNGDKVSLTFKGVTKEVDRTEAGVLKAITAFGKMPGVIGMTAKISETLDGQISNLGDNFDRLKTTIGGDLNFSFKDLVKFANLAIDTFIQVWKQTLPIRDAFAILAAAAQDVGRAFWGTVKAIFDLKDASEGGAFALELLTKGFKAVAIVLVAAFSHLQLMVGGLNVLLNKGKEVANFFGADFNIDPRATFGNVINDFKKAGTRIKEIWDGTKKEVNKPLTPGAGGNTTDTTGGTGTPPPDPKKVAAEQLAIEKDATERRLKLLELRYAKGLISEQQYNDQKHKIQVDATNREIALLKKQGADKAGEVRDANNKLLGLEIQHVKDNKAEAEKRLKDAIDMEKTQTKQRLGEIELMHNEGKLTEVQFIQERADAEQKGIHNIQKLLKAAGKQKTADFVETETELNAIAAKLAGERTKIEEKAWKDAVDAVKKGLDSIDNETKGKLTGQVADLDKKYIEQEGDIKRRIANRKVSEQKGEEELYNLKQGYLTKLSELTAAAYDEDEKKSKELLDTLQANAKTELQKKEATALAAEEIAKNALEKQKENSAASVEIKKTEQERMTQVTQEEADKRQAIQDKGWELAIAAVGAYFEITSGFREQELANLEKQKNHELELAGENDEAKKVIEQRYADRQRELKRRQARSDKAAAAFNVVLNTAMGVANATAKTLTIPLIPFIIALGALQLATVLASPVPEFFKGKKDNYEGPGYVGDRGYEFVERNDPKTGKSTFEFAAQKQLMYLGRHDRVYTHEESKRMIQKNEGLASTIRQSSPMPYERAYAPAGPVLSKTDLFDAIRAAFSEQPVYRTDLTENGLRRFIDKHNSTTEYLNDRRSFPRKNG